MPSVGLNRSFITASRSAGASFSWSSQVEVSVKAAPKPRMRWSTVVGVTAIVWAPSSTYGPKARSDCRASPWVTTGGMVGSAAETVVR